MSQRVRLVACATAIALIAAACGGSESNSASNRTRNAALNDCVNAVGANQSAISDANTAIGVASTSFNKAKSTLTKAQKTYSKERKRRPVRKTNLKKAYTAYKKARVALKVSSDAYTSALTKLSIAAATANCVVSADTTEQVAPPSTVAFETNLAISTGSDGSEIGSTDTPTTTLPTSTSSGVTSPTSSTVTPSSTTLAPTTTRATTVITVRTTTTTTTPPSRAKAGSKFVGASSSSGYRLGAASDDGVIVAVITTSGSIYISKNKGGSFARVALSYQGDATSVAVSPRGTNIAVAIPSASAILFSGDSGATFTKISTPVTPQSVAVNESVVVAAGKGGFVRSIIKGGLVGSWSSATMNSVPFLSIDMSAGSHLNAAIVAIGDGFDNVFVSRDAGRTWSTALGDEQWLWARMSDDGQHMVVRSWWGQIFISHDSGNTWTQAMKFDEGAPQYGSIDIANDGQYLIAGKQYGPKVGISRDGGKTWSETTVDESMTIMPSMSVFVSGDASIVGTVSPIWYRPIFISVS